MVVVTIVTIMTVTLGATHEAVVAADVVGASAAAVIVRTLPLRSAIVIGTIGVAMWQCRQWRSAMLIPNAPPTVLLAAVLLLCVV